MIQQLRALIANDRIKEIDTRLKKLEGELNTLNQEEEEITQRYNDI